jgi:hypothetical protein
MPVMRKGTLLYARHGKGDLLHACHRKRDLLYACHWNITPFYYKAVTIFFKSSLTPLKKAVIMCKTLCNCCIFVYNINHSTLIAGTMDLIFQLVQPCQLVSFISVSWFGFASWYVISVSWFGFASWYVSPGGGSLVILVGHTSVLSDWIIPPFNGKARTNCEKYYPFLRESKDSYKNNTPFNGKTRTFSPPIHPFYRQSKDCFPQKYPFFNENSDILVK